jgi:tetratricopeptide (TPR) repeat protein
MTEAGRDLYSAGRDIIFTSSPAAHALADELARLSPGAAADQLTDLRYARQASALAAMPPEAVASILQVFLRRRREDLVVALLADIHPDIARGIARVLVALEQERQWLADVPEAAAAVRKCADECDPDLGKAVRQLVHVESSWGNGFRRFYERGTVHWALGPVAYATTGKIEEYRGSSEWLGFPVSSEESAPGGGKQQRFSYGTVYWSGGAEDGAHATWGAIRERYERDGGPGGDLGYPVSDRFAVGDEAEARHMQRFDRGTVYVVNDANAVAVPLDIIEYQGKTDRAADLLGCPVGDFREAAAAPPQNRNSTESVSSYREAVRLDPGNWRLHDALGMALHSQQRHAEAVEVYREVIRLEPGYAWAHRGLGISLYALQRYGEAAEAYREAIRLDPDVPTFHLELGHALAAQKR